ncbi:MAG TPA: DUF177 domain-containing protein [Verrucomicrobiae bacterium]|nr:DUF177 domain-containing protein [Verrucomicrobiae bacterium]
MIIHATELDPDGVQLDFPVATTSLPVGPGESILVHRAVLRGRAVPKRGGVSLAGSLSGDVEVSCARCLKPFGMTVNREFDLFYALSPVKGKEVQIPDDALDYEFLHDGDAIDLQQVAAEQIYLEIPMKPLCTPECRGLCPGCGIDLNESDCGGHDASTNL